MSRGSSAVTFAAPFAPGLTQQFAVRTSFLESASRGFLSFVETNRVRYARALIWAMRAPMVSNALSSRCVSAVVATLGLIDREGIARLIV